MEITNFDCVNYQPASVGRSTNVSDRGSIRFGDHLPNSAWQRLSRAGMQHQRYLESTARKAGPHGSFATASCN